MTRDDMAARLVAIFLEELQEHLGRMNDDLLALESDPLDSERLRSLFRSAHTLKGAARAAAVPSVEATCHALESLLVKARDGRLTLGEAEFALLFSAVDALVDAGERLRSGRPLEDAPVASLARSLQGGGITGAAPAAHDTVSAADETAPPAHDTVSAADATAPPPDDPRLSRRSEGRVRLEPEKLDALLASAGELLVLTSRLGGRPARTRDIHRRAGHCAAEWARLERRLRPVLEDPATQRAAEAFGQALGHLVADSDRATRDAIEEASLLGRLAHDVGGRMHALRMRPFADACEALPRTVRDLAAAAGKKVRLRITGRAIEADRVVLDAVREALLHLVRNAVDHGIELPGVRRRGNKPETGTVDVRAELRGERLRVSVQDDGGGLDVGAVRAELERRGRPVPDENAALAAILLRGGISTRAEATAISGRGVGLDAVRAATDRVRGVVEVAWEAGAWTRITLDCPLRLSAVRALLVRVSGQTFALPSANVGRLLRVPAADVRRAEGRDVLTGDDGPVMLVRLADLLGLPLAAEALEDPLPVVRLRSGDRRLAVAVDALVAEQELLVRPLQPLPHPSPYLAGAALLGSGEVAILLHTDAVVATGIAEPPARSAGVPVTATATSRKRILLADDSVTTRTLEQSILEGAGYEVLAAADGAEAWRILQEQPCDLVVSDVEMPRMDGFELCETIRRSKRYSAVPVVLVTALEAAEDRARGLEAGADAYIAKSSFEQDELLDAIHRLIG